MSKNKLIQNHLKNHLLTKIKKNGGFVNCHAHFDRSYTVNRDILNQSLEVMEKKWTLVDSMKRKSGIEDYYRRIETSLNLMIDQGVKNCCTFIDIDPITELRALTAALMVKKKYRAKCNLLIINQVLKGVIDKKAKRWAERVLDQVDIIGGLPSKDRPMAGRHLDTIFSWAKLTGKMVHVHIDQENNPDEHDSELLAKKTIKFGLEGKVVAVHAISIAAQPPKKRQEIYKLLKAAGIIVVCCPSAALSMKAMPKRSHLHNSVAPVPELLEQGIPVALGVDNIGDIYQPLVDGDLYTELRFLAESCRFYDLDQLTEIATNNGRKALGLN